MEEIGEEKALGGGGEDPVLAFGRVLTKGKRTLLTLVIAGQVEGHQSLPPPAKATRYEHILPQLVEAEERSDVEGVLFLINTVGGDVEAGLAMAEMIAGMKKPTVSLVLGGGHSIGIPLAVAAKKSFIAPSASMTVHPVRIQGLVLGVPQSFEYLRRMQERIDDFVVRHSGILPERLSELMAGRHDMATDIGTVLGGREAVEAGLVDAVGNFSDAKAALEEMIEREKS
ncbi:MAG: ATP-dependent Clp protease proteolytic subunit [Clostridia bacterium]|nr:ATP-dependent Clp protease proteolytic subunit [Clostridia bacterium]